MTDMWDMLRSTPDQFRWASELSLPELPEASAVLVAGMGGSGVAGDYAGPIAAAAGIKIDTHKTYGLPGWAGKQRPLFVAVSYSGDTEETLSAYRAAADLGLDLVAITGGGQLAGLADGAGVPVVSLPQGLQPRAALGYLVGSLLRILGSCAGLNDVRGELEEAAGVVTGLLEGDAPGLALARDLADGLAGRIVLVYGSEGPTGVVARRWKTQVNENAKAPAFAAVLPEADHNEIAGWGAQNLGRHLGVVLLRDGEEHARVAARFRLTREQMSPGVSVVGEVHATGDSMLARMASLTAIGDAMSIYLAEAAEVDPVSVAAIDRLKEALGHES